jgi:pyridoxal phosphate enzyme (YggS family)
LGLTDYGYIEQNLIALRKRIAKICTDCGRSPGEVYLIAVSKSFPVEAAASALDFNQLDFGENRVQELLGKQKALEHRILHWHLVGHLQSNKVKFIVPFIFMIHSVDSFKLALKINSDAEKINRKIRCLVQVNVSNEPQKSGCRPTEAVNLARQMSELPFVRLKGLMTIGRMMSDESSNSERNKVREDFKILKEKFDEIKSLNLPGSDMKYLSMGMTADYDIAIEEGSNMVRIGTAIFGRREM